MSDLPTARQLELLSFIESHTRSHGYPPSIRDMCHAFGIESTNGVVDHLHALEAKGLVERTARTARSLVITPYGRAWLEGAAP